MLFFYNLIGQLCLSGPGYGNLTVIFIFRQASLSLLCGSPPSRSLTSLVNLELKQELTLLKKDTIIRALRAYCAWIEFLEPVRYCDVTPSFSNLWIIARVCFFPRCFEKQGFHCTRDCFVLIDCALHYQTFLWLAHGHIKFFSSKNVHSNNGGDILVFLKQQTLWNPFTYVSHELSFSSVV